MSKTLLTKAAAVAALSVVAIAGPASAAILADQPFDSGTGDWTEYGATVANDSGALRVTGVGDNYGAYSYFDGVTLSTGTERTTPLGLGYIAEIDAYLDPASIKVGEGFDLSVAASKIDGDHRRDFIFHVGGTGDGLLVNGSNNTDFSVNEYKLRNENGGNFYTVTDAGWYTFQHSFYEKDGALAVDLNLLDTNDKVLWTATRSNAGDIATEVGGAQYQWLTVVTGSFAFDNQSLERGEAVAAAPVTKDDCKKGGWATFDFKNQGQCIDSLQASEKAGK